jgi:chromosome partitioning protein
MASKIIVVCNQKGGSGKTTLSMQLAGALARAGGRVLVADADPQGTATRWAASADDATPFPAAVTGFSAVGGKIHREIQKFVPNYDWIIVDCPPAVDSPVPQAALLVADLALVPVIPSPLDLWAAVGIKSVIANAMVINEALAARLVLNQCQATKTLAKEALEVLPQFGIAPCETFLGAREVYRQSPVYGQTVYDFGNRAAAATAEIESLAEEVRRIVVGAETARR